MWFSKTKVWKNILPLVAPSDAKKTSDNENNVVVGACLGINTSLGYIDSGVGEDGLHTLDLFLYLFHS